MNSVILKVQLNVFISKSFKIIIPMKKYLPLLLLFTFIQGSQTLQSQSLIGHYKIGMYNCFPFSVCSPRSAYDIAANSTTGKLYVLAQDYHPSLWVNVDKLIKFDSLGNRLLDTTLTAATYSHLVLDESTGAYVLSVRHDSVMVTRFSQNNLAPSWSTGVLSMSGNPEPFGMCIAFGYIYLGFNDSTGMHLCKLDKSTGAVVSSIDYNTAVVSEEHGLEIKASFHAIYVAGYLSQPGTLYGDQFWLAKFTAGLSFSWQKVYDKNLAMTNNTDRASHLSINHDTIYVCGTITDPGGNVDATVFKYAQNGTRLWQKSVNRALIDHDVNCAIDKSNGDVYLLQNGFTTVNKIFITRFDASGNPQWHKSYASTDTMASTTLGRSIQADPNPGGGGCEIYISGQHEDEGGDGHGHTSDGLNFLFYKYNRNGVRTLIFAPDVAQAPGGLAPYLYFKKSIYFPDYTGRPCLLLLGEGDFTDTYPGFIGWMWHLYDISSTARLADQHPSDFQDQQQLMQLFPNPASNRIYVRSDQNIETICLFNTQGQLIREVVMQAAEGSFSVSDIPKGMYFVRGIMNGSTTYSRIIVQ